MELEDMKAVCELLVEVKGKDSEIPTSVAIRRLQIAYRQWVERRESIKESYEAIWHDPTQEEEISQRAYQELVRAKMAATPGAESIEVSAEELQAKCREIRGATY